MPIAITRDDEQRRITVIVSDPWSVEEIAIAVDRQLAEQVWTYGTLYDLRGSNWVPSEADVLWLVKRGQQQVARHGARGAVAVLLDGNNQADLLRKLRGVRRRTQPSHRGGVRGSVRGQAVADRPPAHLTLRPAAPCKANGPEVSGPLSSERC